MNPEKEMDKKAPGGVYLCQVNEKISCGACCGLYNVPDLSREKLYDMLFRRTAGFSKVPREAEAIINFGEEVLYKNKNKRPYDEFYHCPYIGLIGIIKKFIGFKASWPFRLSSDTAANYFFKDKLYERKPVDYSGINYDRPFSRYDVIFRELGSSFNSVEEIRYAESMIDELLKRIR